ncbi:unnamed protein product [Periconia digitata]|uniref:Uncharacterized protein n=1 Tax=Periconia digitata TaxID=1303443 RepID=A0A9W4UN00_9PLEO|nr:unnamed protein product [Periconia digitata]
MAATTSTTKKRRASSNSKDKSLSKVQKKDTASTTLSKATSNKKVLQKPSKKTTKTTTAAAAAAASKKSIPAKDPKPIKNKKVNVPSKTTSIKKEEDKDKLVNCKNTSKDPIVIDDDDDDEKSNLAAQILALEQENATLKTNLKTAKERTSLQKEYNTLLQTYKKLQALHNTTEQELAKERKKQLPPSLTSTQGSSNTAEAEAEDLESKMQTLQRNYLAIRPDFDTLQHMARQVILISQNMPLLSLGEFGTKLKDLKTCMEELERKKRGGGG